MGNEKDTLLFISKWRDQLVDLTRRNPLLNYKSSKKSAVEVQLPESFTALKLLFSGNDVVLRHLLEKVTTKNSEDLLSENQVQKDITKPVENININYWYANLDQDDLRGRLRNLERKTSQEFLDRGVWTLYVAFGKLTWVDADKQTFQAPLLLIPIALKYSPERQCWLLRIQEDNEEIVLNPALLLKAEQLGVTLPKPDLSDESFDAGIWMDLLQESLSEARGWSTSAHVAISRFTFFKEAMYKDLLENASLISSHNVVKAIVDPENHSLSPSELFDPQEVDLKASPEVIPTVLDADSSQRAAIATAINGASIVIDGPPGTGKSQTIANLIAGYLCNQKSVLFVSEKSAALEVVKNRLESVGLGPYILEIHSHKATRKAVAQNLGDAVAKKPSANLNISSTEILRAKQARESLSKLADLVNDKANALGRSFNELVGEIELLKEVDSPPLIDVEGENINLELCTNLRLLGREAERYWRVVLDVDFPWREVLTDKDLSNDISTVETLLKDLENATETFSELLKSFSPRLTMLDKLLDLCDMISNDSTILDPVWISDENRESTINLANQFIAALERIEVSEEYLSKNLRLSDLAPDISITSPQIKNERLEAFSKLTHRDLIAAREKLQSLDLELESCEAIIAQFDSDFSVNLQLSLEALCLRQQIIDIALSEKRIPTDWLKPSNVNRVSDAIHELRSAHIEEFEARVKASKYWTDKALELDLMPVIDRIRNSSLFSRLFSRTFREDRKTLLKVRNQKVSIKGLISEYTLLETWKQKRSKLRTEQLNHAKLLDPLYEDEKTVWMILEQCLSDIKLIHHALGNSLNSKQKALFTTQLGPKESEHLHAVRDLIEEISDNISYLELPGELNSLINKKTLHSLKTDTERVLQDLGQLGKPFEQIDTFLYDDSSIKVSDLIEVVSFQSQRYASAVWIRSNEEDLRKISPHHQGVRTNRSLLQEHLRKCEAVVESCDGLVTDSRIDALNSCSTLNTTLLRQTLLTYISAIKDFSKHFSEERRVDVLNDLDYLDTAIEFLSRLREDTSGQKAWFEFKKLEKRTSQIGASQVWNYCVDRRVSSTLLESIFYKSAILKFLAWFAKKNLVGVPVSSFERDELVRQFKEIDLKLVRNSIGMISNEANKIRPAVSFGSANIIRSEYLKQRRHMSIRDLLDKTHDVAKAVKPVFMMSPLSVSQFLPPQMRFDVVIFDEASQVKPSDAINCIYRGNSLVIAGDDKQLPPTSYWESAEEDDNDSESDATDFESILDISKRAMPTRSLLWHYRSRHEDLIAFSNKRFYGGSLFTFPSSHEISENLGVSFYKVDGIYNRGTTRDNPIEAQKVIERIEYHFDNRPGKTLGVVTFSEAQKTRVENELEKLRQRRPDFDRFFSIEDADARLKGFFVKNLESVQGDERDVIIFSIGYGKDENGKWTNNFGPLNKDKGWRRLNVAITRALYRVEVVSSITASDINDSPTVKNIKDYLAYAERGPGILQIDDSSEDLPTESPFEDAVKAQIENWGYQVKPQVGTAGYRIDLGVRHPSKNGVFLLGVECDGYAYHSSKVARDRDRLREQVLVNLGWRIHRIWGTAWYSNRELECERLKDAIEKALVQETPFHQERSNQSGTNDVKITLEPEIVEATPEWVVNFETIPQATVNDYFPPGDTRALGAIKEFLYEVVVFEYPVSNDQLKQRMRSFWEIGSFGANIKSNFDNALNELLRGRKIKEIEPGFYSIPNGDPRVRVHVNEFRKVEDVSLEELSLALQNLVSDAISVHSDELVTRAVRLFGWERTGLTILGRLRKALDFAVQQKKLKVDSGGFVRRS